MSLHLLERRRRNSTQAEAEVKPLTSLSELAKLFKAGIMDSSAFAREPKLPLSSPLKKAMVQVALELLFPEALLLTSMLKSLMSQLRPLPLSLRRTFSRLSMETKAES